MLPVEVLAAIDAVATAQHGLLTDDQLLEVGFSRARIRSWLDRGVIVRCAVGVVRLNGAPGSWRQRVMAASLTSGGLASHRTAAALHGLDGFAPALIEVVTERWSRVRRDGFVLHETMDLRDIDCDEVAGIPCTSLVRTLIDLPAVCSADHAGQALDHACRRDDRVLLAVRQRFTEVARRGRNGTVRMRLLLNERLADPVREDSRFETQTLRLIRNAGLPEPAKQHEVRFADGTRAFLDLSWPDLLVAVECDSLAHHFGKRAHQRDRQRRRKLKLLGWDIYEYTYDDVTRRGIVVISELRRALELAKARNGVDK